MSIQHAIGTNPLAFAAPGQGDDCFCLDMATSAVAFGRYSKGKLTGPKMYKLFIY